MGIPVLHKTIPQLRHDLSEKSKIYGQNEEKEEKNPLKMLSIKGFTRLSTTTQNLRKHNSH